MLYGSGVLDGDDDCPLPSAPAAVSEAFGSFRKFPKGPFGRFRRELCRKFPEASDLAVHGRAGPVPCRIRGTEGGKLVASRVLEEICGYSGYSHGTMMKYFSGSRAIPLPISHSLSLMNPEYHVGYLRATCIYTRVPRGVPACNMYIFIATDHVQPVRDTTCNTQRAT
jgi:hypothetical protein